MCARHRRVSDEEIFDAAARAMSQRGPRELTLAHIAAQAGVTAGLLVQRFGSKRELMLAMSARYAQGAAGMFEGLRRPGRSPLGVLRAYAKCQAGLGETPETMTRNLAYLQNDLEDEDFRGYLVRAARIGRRRIESLLREAVAAGELRKETDVRKLARAAETTLSGSLMTWACYREGTAARWLLRDLEFLLEPYLPR